MTRKRGNLQDGGLTLSDKVCIVVPMSRYRLFNKAGSTEFIVKGTSPAKALRELCEQAGYELESQDGRYGRTTEGEFVSAMTEAWGRRKLDPMERQTRVGAPR